jgi:divalent metal cation (Fe/Co/Zn/Cd) transporter
MAVSAIGLAATGLVELLLAVLTGSVGLLGAAIHNLSDVSTSAVTHPVSLTGAAPAARGDRRRPGPGDRGARGPR